MSDVFTMQERVEKSLTPQRTPMVLSMAFAVVALLLAAIGIYGVLAYEVSQRTREFGIRMALGSDARKVLGLVLREGVVLVVVGLAAGVVGAALLRRLIASQLYGVGAFDPMVLLAVTGVLALVSLFACLGPARRAATVDPVNRSGTTVRAVVPALSRLRHCHTGIALDFHLHARPSDRRGRDDCSALERISPMRRERAPRASHATGPPTPRLRRGLAVALRAERKRAGDAAREGACRGVRGAKPLG